MDDLTAERPVRDIARAHELVIDVAPSVAVPAAASMTRDCILEVGIAVVLAHDFPRERRADPREQFHRNSPKPTLNLVADLTNPLWDKMVPDPRYRCLIPLTAFAQPEGPRGRMTRTWFRVRDWPVFAWAGFCRRTEEWGRSMPP